MSRGRHRYQSKPEPEPAVPEVAKLRYCLMCGVSFPSAWSGERICQRCKARAAWREGVCWPPGGRAA